MFVPLAHVGKWISRFSNLFSNQNSISKRASVARTATRWRLDPPPRTLRRSWPARLSGRAAAPARAAAPPSPTPLRAEEETHHRCFKSEPSFVCAPSLSWQKESERETGDSPVLRAPPGSLNVGPRLSLSRRSFGLKSNKCGWPCRCVSITARAFRPIPSASYAFLYSCVQGRQDARGAPAARVRKRWVSRGARGARAGSRCWICTSSCFSGSVLLASDSSVFVPKSYFSAHAPRAR